MHRNLNPRVILIFVIAVIFSMYQETSAQNKRPKKSKPEVIEVKPVMPEISYTVSMSKPWTASFGS